MNRWQSKEERNLTQTDDARRRDKGAVFPSVIPFRDGSCVPVLSVQNWDSYVSRSAAVLAVRCRGYPLRSFLARTVRIE